MKIMTLHTSLLIGAALLTATAAGCRTQQKESETPQGTKAEAGVTPTNLSFLFTGSVLGELEPCG